ncbi:MAG: adenylate/guanylate cyclase domain-containing protein [Rhizobiaceae bacterium]|nr:adenylate/guanylate cyclase domain-containing protein [Rhizobiaceae bacterium]
MALSFGTLVFLSVGGVLALSVTANYRNTFELLRSQANLLIDAMEDSLRGHMSHPEDAVEGLAKLYAAGGFEIDDGKSMDAALAGALAAVPEASGVLVFTDDTVSRGVVRTSGGDRPDGAFRILPPEPVTSAQILTLLEARRTVDGLRWGSFVVNEGGLYANVSLPLVRDGVRRGLVVVPVELQTLSKVALDLSTRFGTHAFLLDGDNRILAIERLADPAARENGLQPLMALTSIGDPVLARFATRKQLTEFQTGKPLNVEVAEIRTTTTESGWKRWLGDTVYISITRRIEGYGDQPWTIGAYYTRGELGDEVLRAWVSAVLGIIGLACALIAAILLGRRLSLPIQTIAGQAQRVAAFELDGVAPLPPSRVRELDDQASAFNAMLVGLRAFSTYIPRALVAKLVRSGEIDVAQPREAIVTVMFTDIAGFTTLSESLDAASGARLLNHHFEILCRAIDAQGGTVDKFMGDGMMAFFGAPDRLKGHAAAAVRAAALIRQSLDEDNRLAGREGRPALRIRIGIHTGPAIVGNIGAADRVNYTIVGDTVNVSQRLQEIGKLLAPDDATAIAISGETASRLDERFETIPAGKHRLRGRGEAIEVFLVGDVEMDERAATHGSDAA